MKRRLACGKSKRCEACEGMAHRRAAPACLVCGALPGPEPQVARPRVLVSSPAVWWKP